MGFTGGVALTSIRQRRIDFPDSDGSDSTDQEEITRVLEEGRRSLEKLRWRHAALWILLSVFLYLMEAFYFAYEHVYHDEDLQQSTGLLARSIVHAKWARHFLIFLQGILENMLLWWGLMLLPMFAPTASLMRLALVTLIVLRSFENLHFILPVLQSQKGGCLRPNECDIHYKDVLFQSAWVALGVLFVCGALWAISRPSIWEIQRSMWRFMSLWSVLYIVYKCADLVDDFKSSLSLEHNVPTTAGNQLSADLWEVFNCQATEILTSMLVFYMLAKHQEVLESLNAKIRRKMETNCASCAAASVACLIGSVSPSTVTARARKRFRSVGVNYIEFEDVSHNTPNPSLGLRAAPSCLGRCDAFFSHSWHDDPSGKWKAMQSWASSFRASEGREPTIWFDKFCIDQNDIEMDLQCLPVFLSGCNRLVILCGTTYLSRLWCIIEMFTYIMVGGRLENIDVVPVVKDDGDDGDLEGIIASFENFDAAHCKCFNPGDKDRLLMVIRTAFGSVSAFNVKVSEILKSFLKDSKISAQLSLASTAPRGGRP